MRLLIPTMGFLLVAALQFAAPMANAQQYAPSSGSPASGQMQMGSGMAGMAHMKCPDPKRSQII